jgi:hypothetical protein
MDATPHIIESALLLLVAFLLGCVVGYFARRISGSRGSSAAKPAVPLTVDAPAPDGPANLAAAVRVAATPEAANRVGQNDAPCCARCARSAS